MNNLKRIAYIFEEEKIFLTKDGLYYRFDDENGKVKCQRLTEKEKEAFLCYVRPHAAQDYQETGGEWHPVARPEYQHDGVVLQQNFIFVKKQRHLTQEKRL